MNNLKEIIVFLIIAINAGGAFRISYCLIRINGSPDELGSYMKKIINVLIFLVLANLSLSIMLLIRNYFVEV
jgi:hypothetical protein